MYVQYRNKNLETIEKVCINKRSSESSKFHKPEKDHCCSVNFLSETHATSYIFNEKNPSLRKYTLSFLKSSASYLYEVYKKYYIYFTVLLH